MTRDGRPAPAHPGPPNLVAVNLVATLGILVLVALLVHPESGTPTAGSPAAGSAGSVAGWPARGPTGAPPVPGRPPGAPSPAAGTPPVPGTPPKPAGTAVPVRIRIPDIGVDAPLESLHLAPDGALAPPRSWDDAGWYADGTRPGDVGPAVVAGHIDSTRGPAVFYRLDRLRPGALIEVERAGQWLSFRAVSVAEYPKNAFPSAQVYGPTPDPQLRLITCGGGFDRTRGSYVDNTVVYAVAA